jgi:WD40 repeat protein
MLGKNAFQYGGLLALIMLSAIGGCPAVDTGGGTGGTGSSGGSSGSSGTDSFALPPTVVLTSDVVIGVLPLTVSFGSTLSTDDGLIVSRLWDFGDGTTASDLNPEHTYTTTGIFTVTLTLTDDQGASASDTVEITVTEAPVAQFTVDPESASAENAPATFTFDPSSSFDPDGSIVQYQWDFGDGALLTLAEADVVSHIYARGGNYRVTLTVIDNIGVQSDFTRSLRVGIPQPTIEFTTPPATSRRIIYPQDSPIWAVVQRDSQIGVPSFLTAGVDRDFDQCDAKAIVYVVGTGEERFELTGHGDRVLTAAFRPNDGDRVITGSADMTSRLYDQNGSFVLAFDSDTTTPAAVTAIDIAPMSNGETTFFYGLADGRIAGQVVTSSAVPTFFGGIHTAQVNALEISPDGSFAVSGGNDNQVRAWQTTDGAVLASLTNGGAMHAGAVNDVSFAAAASVVASASADMTVRVWQIPNFSTPLAVFTNHTTPVQAVAVSPNGDRVLSGEASGGVFLWNPSDLSVLGDFSEASEVTAVAYAADPDVSRIAIGTATGEVRIYDPEIGAVPLVTLNPCISPITALEFSPNSAELLVGIGAQNSIQLDIVGTPNGNDLNLTVPQPLNIASAASLNGGPVPAGVYYLWADLATDRTETERAYAGLVDGYEMPIEIVITDAFTSVLGTPPARVPYAVGSGDALRDLDFPEIDVVYAIPPDNNSTVRRQIIDIGRLEAGDQIIFSYLTIPGHSPYYRESSVTSTITDFFLFNTNDGSEVDGSFSALLLNELLDGGGNVISASNMLAWYSNISSELTPETRIPIRNASDHHYFVVDSGTSLRIRISPPANDVVRDQRLESRDQRVLLDFDAAIQVAIGGINPVDIPALDFQLTDGRVRNLQTPLTPAEIESVKTQLVARLQTLFANATYSDPDTGLPRGIQFFRSDQQIPSPPYKRILFGSLLDFPTSGLGTVDVRAAQGLTETGSAVVGMNAGYIDPNDPTASRNLAHFAPQFIGTAMGNAAGHILGRMLGLQNTNNLGGQDIMDSTLILIDPRLNTYTFTTGPIPQFDPRVGGSIGEQVADQYLADIYGPPAP